MLQMVSESNLESYTGCILVVAGAFIAVEAVRGAFVFLFSFQDAACSRVRRFASGNGTKVERRAGFIEASVAAGTRQKDTAPDSNP